jgi:hypothetical protein
MALREQCYCAQRMLNESKHCFLFCEDYVQCYGHCGAKKKEEQCPPLRMSFRFSLVQRKSFCAPCRSFAKPNRRTMYLHRPLIVRGLCIG